MYEYTDFDKRFIRQRAAQFRDQLERHLAGQLPEDDFRPLRLQNGWYVQRHAPMLRVAVPYGEISAAQLRALAEIAGTYDRGYGHFTTRQNLQYNWIPLHSAADVMDALAAVNMHGIQTSGNCIRNITSDALAGIAPDEVVDPRPYAELLRQWSTLHPEFAFLPRKFKIAISGASEDRAAIAWHDIGLRLRKSDSGEVGFQVLVGGGMGRTPVIATTIREFLPWQQILVFIEAIVRVYNRYGRRDDAYKARIKILVKAEGRKFIDAVNAEFADILENDAAGSAHLEAALARFSSDREAWYYAGLAALAGFALGLAGFPGKLLEAARYRRAFAGAGYRTGTWIQEARGEGRLASVVLTDGSRSLEVPCDLAAVAYGLVPNTEMARLLGCEVRAGSVVADSRQETSVAGVFCAGEPCGVAGVDVAVAEGEIAGLAAAQRYDEGGDGERRLARTRTRGRRLAAAMDRAFRPRAELRALARPDTIVCRCEDVDLSALAACGGAREAKLSSRAGMGACQGRVCGPALEFLFGWESDTVRPPARPAALGNLLSSEESA